jgi:outer membrane protein TolC
VQAINGQVQTVSRNSLFFGTTASLANSFPAAPPGSGFPPLNTLSGVLRISDAIYGTRAARRVIAANEAVIRLIPDDVSLDDLICQGWQNRPELARSRQLVEAAVLRLKQAKLRPFAPSLAITYSGGGFGGGPNAFFGNFNTRGDFAASLFWELRGLGLSDYGAYRIAKAQRHTADIDFVRVQAQVANDVVAAYKFRVASADAMEDARESVTEAVESLQLNLANIRRGGGLPGATRPIEVLQPIQALAQARSDYLGAVLAYNRAQFRLYRAIGQAPHLDAPPPAPVPHAGTTPVGGPEGSASR